MGGRGRAFIKADWNMKQKRFIVLVTYWLDRFLKEGIVNIIDKVELFQNNLNENASFQKMRLHEIRNDYLVGLTWTSNALEGNSLTEAETKMLIEDGITIGGKPVHDMLEAVGHAQAYDYMVSRMDGYTISECDIHILHRLFYHYIAIDGAGIYRKHECIVTGSSYPVTAPEEIENQMKQLDEWMLEKRDQMHPVEFAAQLHKRFVFIHPFEDGNGRVARLIMNLALLQDGYMLAIVPPVLRHDYIQLLEKAHTDDQPFVDFIAERVIETQKDIMRLLHIKISEIER